MSSIDDAKKLLSNNCNQYGGFRDCSPVYEYTTEDIASAIETYNPQDRILTVLSSGDHIFDYILRGAENIESFDLNIITKYYYELKRAIIEKLNYEDFLKIVGQIVPYGLSHLNELNLSEETYEFWSYYKENQLKERYERVLLKSYPPGSRRYNLYFNEDSYNRLQTVLRNGIVTPFHHSTACDLHKKIQGEFSEINFSSIYSLIPKREIPKVIKRLKPHLTDNGQMIFYSFGRKDSKAYSKYHLIEKEINSEDNIYYYKK